MDHELVRRAATGDHVAFSILVTNALRAEPRGEDGGLIVFTLEDGWDTG